MILVKDDKRYPKDMKNGRILWALRNRGGLAKGCMAGGVAFLVCGVLIALLMAVAGLAAGGLLLLLVCAIPALPLILGGLICQKYKMSRYLKYYQKLTGFDMEELKQIEEELGASDMVLYGNVPEMSGTGASEKHPMVACMITRHYFVMPMAMDKSYIRRLSDMLLATYSRRIPGINGYKQGLVFLSRKDDSPYINALLTRDVCGEIISELQARVPGLIPTERFAYEGRTYDIIDQKDEIVELFKHLPVL